MSTLIPGSGGPAADEPQADRSTSDYAAAEGLDELARSTEADRRAWVYVGLGLVGLVAIIAVLVSIVALATSDHDAQPVAAAPVAAAAEHAATETAAAPTAA